MFFSSSDDNAFSENSKIVFIQRYFPLSLPLSLSPPLSPSLSPSPSLSSSPFLLSSLYMNFVLNRITNKGLISMRVDAYLRVGTYMTISPIQMALIQAGHLSEWDTYLSEYSIFLIYFLYLHSYL